MKNMLKQLSNKIMSSSILTKIINMFIVYLIGSYKVTAALAADNNQSLNDVAARQSLKSLYDVMVSKPELTPNIVQVWTSMSGFLKVFSFIMGIIAIFIVVAFIYRYSVDILCILLRGNLGENSWLLRHASESARESGSVFKYMTAHMPSTILALAFAAIIISGYALPIAAKIMQVFGWFIDQLLQIQITS